MKGYMETKAARLPVLKLLLTFIYVLILPVLLLFLAKDPCWTEGWIFCGWYTVLCFTTILYLYRKDPALFSERYRKPGTANQKGWDRYVVCLKTRKEINY
jgi:hypothetical protein